MDPLVRERLFETALIQLGRRGREAMDMADVLRAADVGADEPGVDYADVDACLADAYDWLTRRLDAAVEAGCATAGERDGGREADWPARVRAALDALLAELTAKPELTRVLTTTYPSLGPRQRARYEAFVGSFAPKLRACRQVADAPPSLPLEVDAFAVGAAEAIVVEMIAAGRVAELESTGPEILFSLLVPFLGAAVAGEQMEEARRAR